jgi:hypothetical protein
MDGHFETLIYTDCRPGQGLRGSAGLQFQARSSDAAAAAETLVKDHLLYEPPSRWMAERRPVESYPRSFAHLCVSGYLATAVGLYLGREANGVRQGNQLTHAIVTTDPEDYQDLRPAQLYGAQFWSATPAETTRCEPIVVARGASPYTPARAKKFVLEQPDGPDLLLALVTALERAGMDAAGRVLFLGDDLSEIVEWLVAGTLLVPRARALKLGFKIYTNDPARSSAPIVAVHPEFAGQATRIDNQLGYLVFDLGENRHSPIEPSRSARRWVGLFLDGHPRDAVDALDVAGESNLVKAGESNLVKAGETDRREADEEAAAALGLAAILHQEPPEQHAEAIVGWLRHGPERLRDAYAADLADLFAEVPERWSRRVLRLLDEVGCDGLLPGKAAEVRIALLLKDIEEAIAGGEVSAERPPPLPPGEWGEERDEQVCELLREALETPGRPGSTVEALLRLAQRYGAALHPAELGPPARELVRYLADHPPLMRASNWPNGTEVEDMLIEELKAQAGRGPAEPAFVGDRWGIWLLRRRNLLPPELLSVTLGTALRHSDDRAGLLRKELGAVRDDPGTYALRATQLFSQSPPTPEEIRLILDTAPDGTPPLNPILRGFADRIAGKGPVTVAQLALCRDLVRRGLLEPSRILETTLSRDEMVSETLDQLRGVPRQERVEALLRDLTLAESRLIEPRLTDVAAALVALPVFVPLDKLLGRNPGLVLPYLRGLVAAMRKQARPALAAAAIYQQHRILIKPEDDERAAAIGEALDHWLLWAPEKRVTEAGDQLAAVGGKIWATLWAERVESLAGRRKRYRVRHPLKGRS